MAVYNLENYLAKDGLGFPMNFRRGNPNPLDNSSVWAVLSAAQNYAANDPTAYVGQLLTVVYEDEEKQIINPTAYVIKDVLGTLEPVGTIPLGDDKTVEVAEDGTVSLYGLAGIPDVANKKYQPVLVEGVLTWQELSATTVEGLDASIKALEEQFSGVQTDINAAQEGVTELQGVVGNAESGLVKGVADNTSNITSLLERMGESETNHTTLAGRVDTAESEIDELQAQIQGLTGAMHFAGAVEELPADGAEGYNNGDVVVVTSSHKEYVYDGAVWHELGDEGSYITKTEVADTYETKADATSKKTALETLIAEEASRAQGIEEGHAGRLEALELVGAEKNVIASVDEAQFSIDENRNLTLLDIAMGKVTGLEDALRNKVGVEEGNRLITSDEIAKLEKITLGDDGSIVVDGSIDATKVTDLAKWVTDNRETVPGLLTDSDAQLLNNLKNVEAGAEVNDIVAITLAGSENALPIVDRVVDIPVATAEQYGVVRGSAAENKVSVAEDGTMEVNKINISKLSQDEGEFLVLNGGTSAN